MIQMNLELELVWGGKWEHSVSKKPGREVGEPVGGS